MEIRSGAAVVPEGSLFYEDAGTGMPPVVFISGGSMLDRRGWDGQFTDLARRYRVIRYDLRGLGASSQATVPFSLSDDLQRLFDHLGIERAVLVGHSFAGGLAIDFCLEYPERVIGVVAETPALGGFSYSRAFSERNARIFDAYRSGGGEAVVEVILSDPFLAPRDRRARERVRAIVLENVAILEIDPGLMSSIEPPALDRLEEISQPLLVISAEHDDPDNRAVAELLERRVANARRVELKGAAHLAHLDQPQKFNELVREFVHGLATTGEQTRSA